MGFFLGLLLGFLAAAGLAGFGLWRIVSAPIKTLPPNSWKAALVLANRKPAPAVADAEGEGKKKPMSVTASDV